MTEVRTFAWKSQAEKHLLRILNKIYQRLSNNRQKFMKERPEIKFLSIPDIF